MFTCNVNIVYFILDASTLEKDSEILLEGTNDIEQTCNS